MFLFGSLNVESVFRKISYEYGVLNCKTEGVYYKNIFARGSVAKVQRNYGHCNVCDAPSRACVMSLARNFGETRSILDNFKRAVACKRGTKTVDSV